MLNDNIKYIVFDIGWVLAKPKTDHWFIPPNFYNILNDLSNSYEEIKKIISNNMHYLDLRNIKTEDEEYNMFYNFYKHILKDLNYPKITDEILNALADDTVFNDEKFIFYNDVKRNLERLSKNYVLIILSDGWPSSLRVLKNYEIDIYFKEIIISSLHGSVKKDGYLFDDLNKSLDINNNAIFIDDREDTLDVSYNYGFIPIRIDRKENLNKSKYTVIKSLDELV